MGRSFLRKNPGIEVEKLIDWRTLERRYAQVADITNAKNQDYNNALKSAYLEARQKNCKEVWVFNELDPQNVLICCDGWTTVRSLSRILEEQKSQAKPGYYVKGDRAREIFLLQKRSNSFFFRKNAYRLALDCAIRSRLLTYANQLLVNKSSMRQSFYSSTVFIVRNDDRTYVYHIKADGQLDWIEGNIAEFT